MNLYTPATALRAPYPSFARYDLCRYVYLNSALYEVHTVARLVMNSHLGNALANRFAIAEVSILCAVDANLYAPHGLLILQPGKPVIENFRCLN